MIPVNFPEVNKTYAKDQPEYQPLPGFYAKDSAQGEFVTCWKLSFRERLRILFTGRMWACLLTFHQPLTPSLFTTKKSDILRIPKKEK